MNAKKPSPPYISYRLDRWKLALLLVLFLLLLLSALFGHYFAPGAPLS